MPADQFQSGRSVVRAVNLVPKIREDVAQVVADIAVVVNDEDPRTRNRCHGEAPSPEATTSRIVNSLPLPRSLATRSVPRFFSTMERVIASPSPSPRAFVE